MIKTFFAINRDIVILLIVKKRESLLVISSGFFVDCLEKNEANSCIFCEKFITLRRVKLL